MTSIARKLSKIRKAWRRLERFHARLASTGETFGLVAWTGEDSPERDVILREGGRLRGFTRVRGVTDRAVRRHRRRATR